MCCLLCTLLQPSASPTKPQKKNSRPASSGNVTDMEKERIESFLILSMSDVPDVSLNTYSTVQPQVQKCSRVHACKLQLRVHAITVHACT